MYDAFFDKAPEGADGTSALGKKLSEMLGEEEEEDGEEEEERGDEEDDQEDKDSVKDHINDEDTQVAEEKVTQLFGAPKKEVISVSS